MAERDPLERVPQELVDGPPALMDSYIKLLHRANKAMKIKAKKARESELDLIKLEVWKLVALAREDLKRRGT